MHRFQRILLVLDPSVAPTPALDRAAALARAVNASLWVGLFDRGPHLGVLGIVNRKDGARLEQLMRDQLSTRLQALCEQLRQSGLTVHAIDHRGRADADNILDQVAQHHIDLVIKDAGRESALRRLVFLPLDWELLRACPVPIWMVGPDSSGLPQRIGAAVDPSNPEHGAGPLNDRIIGTARRLARIGHGSVKVFTAFTGLPPLLQGLQPSVLSVSASFEDLYQSLREEHAKALSALLSRHDLRTDDAIVLSGDSTRAVLGALEEHRADVLVVGVIRRRGFDRLVMGSTVEQLVGQASCDVLAVTAAAQHAGPTASSAPDADAA
jgi:universal stress protein E